ncbi:helix-turn-helix transcriptional regulator [Bacillus sp. T33-2]|uniref:helix-turn-helix transcriptional regulator n=1 Tax=Bacillus sp. T33-2 TaxID=2054168 RepID=UPI000C78FF4F|nr:helix-turn-helix transcriptional regulator [Bacillus sp. T33-2]PLR93233.1 XRE family transcriptional regulator [Bacillus sp. T33-2]
MKINLKNPEEFKKLLLVKGFSQRSLAETIEISPSYFNLILNGERFPSGKVAKKITDALESEFDDIFFIDDACKSYQK